MEEKTQNMLWVKSKENYLYMIPLLAFLLFHVLLIYLLLLKQKQAD